MIGGGSSDQRRPAAGAGPGDPGDRGQLAALTARHGPGRRGPGTAGGEPPPGLLERLEARRGPGQQDRDDEDQQRDEGEQAARGRNRERERSRGGEECRGSPPLEPGRCPIHGGNGTVPA